MELWKSNNEAYIYLHKEYCRNICKREGSYNKALYCSTYGHAFWLWSICLHDEGRTTLIKILFCLNPKRQNFFFFLSIVKTCPFVWQIILCNIVCEEYQPSIAWPLTPSLVICPESKTSVLWNIFFKVPMSGVCVCVCCFIYIYVCNIHNIYIYTFFYK